VPLAAVKMLLLARWYGLGEAALLEACQDRHSFRRFLGLPPGHGADDARLAEAYRRHAAHAPVEAQNVVHAIEAQLLAGGFSVRPGISAEAVVVETSPAPEPEIAAPGRDDMDAAADLPLLRETSFFQPGEIADLLRQGESAFVRGGARVATKPPFNAPAAELTPPPVREIPPLHAAIEWPWGLTTDLTDRLKIGRDHRFCLFASELQPYLHVSRKHAELTPCPEGVWVRDLKSRNGTFVNDEQLPSGQAILIDADARVRFGPYCVLQLRVKRPD